MAPRWSHCSHAALDVFSGIVKAGASSILIPSVSIVYIAPTLPDSVISKRFLPLACFRPQRSVFHSKNMLVISRLSALRADRWLSVSKIAGPILAKIEYF
jgi:hypothetical protein